MKKKVLIGTFLAAILITATAIPVFATSSNKNASAKNAENTSRYSILYPDTGKMIDRCIEENKDAYLNALADLKAHGIPDPCTKEGKNSYLNALANGSASGHIHDYYKLNMKTGKLTHVRTKKGEKLYRKALASGNTSRYIDGYEIVDLKTGELHFQKILLS